MTSNILQATPAKLRSGDWGARTSCQWEKGHSCTLEVTTRAGKTWTAEYVAVASGPQNGGWSLWAKQPKTSSRRSRGGECYECGEWIKSPNQRCWETGGTCYAQ